MFFINAIKWRIVFVHPHSNFLKRSDETITVGTTDWNTKTVYLSQKLSGPFLEKVLCHELCHCICFSYNIKIPLETEELLCDFMSVYGKEIIFLLDDLLYTIKQNTA